MKTKKYLLIAVALLFFGILFLTNNSYAGTQKLNSLDYNVTINSDGSMDVIETWDIYIEETNTLFKDFKLDKSKYSGITNVSVKQISPTVKNLQEIYEEQYHVKSGCFYALKTGSSKFEIAWNVGLDTSHATRTYQISYRVNDAVKIYNDCTELYWQFVGNTNGIKAKNVTGTIKLPQAVQDMDSLRVWAHGPLSGEIYRTAKDKVTFNVDTLDTRTMLEVRVVTTENIYSACTNIVNRNKFDSILEEEQGWADEANRERLMSRLFIVAVVIATIIVCLIFLGVIIKYIIDGQKLKKKYPKKKVDLKYFRDIPDENNATPANAAYLYYFKSNASAINSYLPRIFSATMLDLALKGLLTFEPINEKEFNIIINSGNTPNLSMDEQIILNILKTAALGTPDSGYDRISTKELLKYSKKKYDTVYPKLKLIPSYAKDYHETSKNIDEEKRDINKKWKNKGSIYLTIALVCFTMIAFVVPAFFIVPLIACSIVCYMNANKVSILSDKGEEEEAQWKALKNYMDDFSLLKDKEVPDLVLWEKYLVYATTFGISSKVIKELKVVYKEMSDPNYFVTHNYAYMYYMADPRFGGNFISTFDKTMTSIYTAAASAYSAAHSSSSSGGGHGGGFSGGGGGRRWRRPEWADVNQENM